jgi:hypothetical protein
MEVIKVNLNPKEIAAEKSRSKKNYLNYLVEQCSMKE